MNVPAYKLYFSNIKDPSLLEIIIYKLYSMNYKFRLGLLYKLIFMLETIAFTKRSKSGECLTKDYIDDTYTQCDSYPEKFIQEIKNNNLEITSGLSGHNNHSRSVLRTVPYQVYKVRLKNGMVLEAADWHLVMTDDSWKRISDCFRYELVLTEKGWSEISEITRLNRHEYMFDLSLDRDHSYYSNGIVSHNTTTTAAYFCWFMIFHPDKNMLVVANKKDTGIEIVKKIKEVLEGLPFFLKPGIVRMSKVQLQLENGCFLKCAATSKTPATGDSLQLLYVDEAAVIAPNIINEFWASIYPTMSSFRGAQIIMSSTPRGKGNLFHKIYDDSINGRNHFVNTRVDWWEVPGRDKEWEAAQRLDIGDEMFNREYGLSFESSTTRLVSAHYIQFTDRIKKKFISRELYRVPDSISSKIFWRPDFDPGNMTYYDFLKRKFLFVVDTAEGIEHGQAGKKDSDYNIINIFELSTISPNRAMKKIIDGSGTLKIQDIMSYRQVGIYMDNFKDEEECAEACKYLAFQVFKTGYKEIDNVRVLVEVNFNGKNWINKFSSHPGYYSLILIKTSRGTEADGQTKLRPGFKTTGGSRGKNYYCELGAKMMDNMQIILQQYDDEHQNKSTLHQIQQFGKNTKGKYEGTCMHDDISVTSLFVSIANDQELFQQWCEEWLELQDPTPNIEKLRRMLEIYVESEPTVSDEEFSRFYQMASAGFNKPIGQQNTYSQLGRQQQNNNMFGGMGRGTPGGGYWRR